jgi:hypothetical protein
LPNCSGGGGVRRRGRRDFVLPKLLHILCAAWALVSSTILIWYFLVDRVLYVAVLHPQMLDYLLENKPLEECWEIIPRIECGKTFLRK